MKKRLLSMLMAVLMIVSLVPGMALADDVKPVIDIKADAAAKQPGIVVTETKDGYDVTITPFLTKTKDQCKPACTNLVSKELITATCEHAGLTVYYCGTCGKQMMNPKVDKALAHDAEFTVVVEPTCEAAGWGYAVCTKCGTAFGVTADTVGDYIEKAENETQAAYAKRVAAVAEKFEKLDHDFAAVTADVKNDEGETVAYAAKAPTHAEFVTVNGKLDGAWSPLAVDKKTGALISRYVGEKGDNRPHSNYVEVDASGYKAGTVCTLCGAVENAKGETLKALNVEHKDYIKVLDAGKLPYTDDDGDKVDGVTATYYCSLCNKTFGGTELPYDEFWSVKTVAEPKIGDVKVYEGETVYKVNNGQLVVATDLNEAVAATCCKEGNTGDVIVYTASGEADKETGKVPGVWMFKESGKKLEKLAHHYVAFENKAATCTEGGENYYGVYKCDNVIDTVDGKDVLCSDLNKKVGEGYKLDKINSATVVGGEVTKAYQDVAKLNHAVAEKVLVEATCQHTGLNALYCTVCNAYVADENGANTYVTAKVKCVAADERANVVEATCTEAGYTGDVVCKWCGTVLEKGEAVEALGHQTEVKDAKEATCTEAGFTGDEVCTVCGEVVKAGEEIPALGHKFENGVCTVCGAEDPDYVVPNPFKDVKEDSPYYDAIIWAVKNEVTAGKTADTFGINDGCTRAQIVTFLYRAAGSPEVSADVVNPFTDVSEDSVYYNAIMWAVENKITAGTTETTFSPNAVCTRGQIVTFLFRASGAEKVEADVNFTDVAAGSYCYDAVAWAVANEITAGKTATTFAPNDTCTRGQAVTFIYRASK